MDCSQPGFSVHRIFQARTLECPYKRGNFGQEEGVRTEGGCQVKTEDGHDASTSQGKPAMSGKPPEVRGSSLEQILPHSLRGTKPADNLISGFQPPDCETIYFYCSSHPVCNSVAAALGS